MKLQKLLYYAQGWYLATEGKHLFPENFEKWQWGPVVPSVYEAFKFHGASSIEKPANPICVGMDTRIKQFLANIWDTYGVRSAIFLSHQSHREAPWLEAPDWFEIIPKESIALYFKNLASELSEAG